MNWFIGVALLLIVLAFNFTGYLLPWDQLAYWASTVGTSLLGYIPLVGNSLSNFIMGGPVLGRAPCETSTPSMCRFASSDGWAGLLPFLEDPQKWRDLPIRSRSGPRRKGHHNPQPGAARDGCRCHHSGRVLIFAMLTPAHCRCSPIPGVSPNPPRPPGSLSACRNCCCTCTHRPPSAWSASSWLLSF